MPLIQMHAYEITVPVWQRPGRFRAVFLTDLHNNIYPGLVEALRKAAPDAVLIGGDMINRPSKHLFPPYYTRGYGLVSRLAEEFTVWYAPGNHEASWANDPRYAEGWKRYRRALAKKGVRFLENKNVPLGDEENPLWLAGAAMEKTQYSHHSARRAAPDPSWLSEKLGQAKPFQLLLAHHPDYAEAYAAWGADLVLAGHLHGGQIRLPGVGGLLAPGYHILPPYTKGLYETDGKAMIVSAGLGTHTIPIRVLNPREALIIDLIKE